MLNRSHKGYTLIEAIGAIGVFVMLFMVMTPLMRCFVQEVPKKVYITENEDVLLSVVESVRNDVQNCDEVLKIDSDNLVMRKGEIQIAYKFTADDVVRYEPWQPEGLNDIKKRSWSHLWLKAEVSSWPAGNEIPKAVNIMVTRNVKEQQPDYAYPLNHLIFLKGEQYGQKQ